MGAGLLRQQAAASCCLTQPCCRLPQQGPAAHLGGGVGGADCAEHAHAGGMHVHAGAPAGSKGVDMCGWFACSSATLPPCRPIQMVLA